MGADSVEHLGEMMQSAYRNRDADAVADLYEDKAIYANVDGGWTAIGRDEIAARVSEMFTMMTVNNWVSEPLLFEEVGDYAFSHETVTTFVSFTDGNAHEFPGRGTWVAHRGSDGSWRMLIDHASGL